MLNTCFCDYIAAVSGIYNINTNNK